MPDVTCAGCGRTLPYDGDRTPSDRIPCSACGSVKRNYLLVLKPGHVGITGGVATMSVTRALLKDLQEQDDGAKGTLGPITLTATATVGPPDEPGDVVLGARLIVPHGRTSDGELVRAVALPWFEILGRAARDPHFLKTIHWRQLEELIAGAFKQDGWPEVELTPPSGDQGRDVIATRPGVGSIRVIAQAKRYSAHPVTLEEVCAVLGALNIHNASKAMVMTTSVFAPGIARNARINSFMPYKLELMDGESLRHWLLKIRSEALGD
jgi:hypothetical protein